MTTITPAPALDPKKIGGVKIHPVDRVRHLGSALGIFTALLSGFHVFPGIGLLSFDLDRKPFSPSQLEGH
ncbi:MAG TPA: hypothetical protein VNW24_12065 [Stellaceae bacterium]|nr:hypothetical protein [Stellaceae bacterium]